MIPERRHAFNQRFTETRYRDYLAALDAAVGMHIEFRINETPIFLTREFTQTLIDAATQILAQVTSPAYLKQSDASFPPGTQAPNENDHPEFVQIDFGCVIERDGSAGIRLIELQGFPSIYAAQELMGRTAIASYGIDGATHLLSGLTIEQYYALLRRVVVKDSDPHNVILLEVDPLHQKTRPDFLWTEKMIGVPTVDITTVEKSGRELFYRDSDGKRIRIDRIYNRAIIDELDRKGTEYAFRFTDDLAVEWACHPNWYYRISKYSIPFLDHPTVPWTKFLCDLQAIPDDLDAFVLKPLYSFAGSGVVVSPTRAQIDAIPDEHRAHYLLQEKVEYAPVLETPSGGTKVELRVMFLWDTEPVPVNLVVRTGRGKMMGVDFNKNLDWVGATSALIEL